MDNSFMTKYKFAIRENEDHQFTMWDIKSSWPQNKD